MKHFLSIGFFLVAAFVLPPQLVLGFERIGVVVDTLEGGQYTYVEVETPGGRYWAATPKIKVSTGDRVDVTPGSEMKDFFSPTLKRSFKIIVFTPSVKVIGKGENGSIPSVPGAPEIF